MVGMMLRHEVDICIGALSLVYERGLVIDYSVGLYEDPLTLNVVRPEGRQVDFVAYLDIFTWPSWIIILLIILG